MLHSIKEIGQASVHSPDASFILFMVSLSIDVESYVCYTLNHITGMSPENVSSLRRFRDLFVPFLQVVHDILLKWLSEAEGNKDLATASVVHSYIALLYTNVQAVELNPDNLATVLGSLAFVRAWHGFGMGQLRSQMEVGGDQETRLMRFLQAHGIDTASMVKEGSLSKWIKSGRTLWLNVGFESIRAPTFVEQDDQSLKKLPPADVPEAKLFALLQAQRRSWIQYLERLDKPLIDKVLNAALRVALCRRYGAALSPFSLESL